MIKIIYNTLKMDLDEFVLKKLSSLLNDELALQIVREMKLYTECDYDEFKVLYWKLISNIKLNSNAEQLRYDILNTDKWTPQTLVCATHDQLDPEKALYRKTKRMMIFTKMEHSAKFLKEEDEHESILECSKCKSKNTEYLSLQTRRGDEGSTYRCHCKNCGHRWKFC